MNHRFQADIEQRLQEQMAIGGYTSESDLLRDALRALEQQNADLASIHAGIDDLQSNRIRPLDDIVTDIRQRQGWTR